MANHLMETYERDNLVICNPKILNKTLANGEAVVRGQILAFDTSALKWKAYASGGSNGVNIPRGIASEDCTASGDTICGVYVAGEFNKNALVVNSGDSVSQTVMESLRDYGVLVTTGQMSAVETEVE